MISSLGEPIDGKGEIKADGYRPVEQPAPSIVDRQSVDTPLATGILSIDSMFPIGRGQRELTILPINPSPTGTPAFLCVLLTLVPCSTPESLSKRITPI